MQIELDRELLNHLMALYRARILDAKGRPNSALFIRKNGRKVLPPFGGFLASSAAYIALTPFKGNDLVNSSHLFQLALDAGERLILDHAHITPDGKPGHFNIYPLAKLYTLLGDKVEKRRLARWRKTMRRNLQAIDALIDRVGDNLGKAGLRAGTGPNHYFGWFAVGYEQALTLGDDKLARKISKAMHRHMKIQSPAGYFPEQYGPATVYHNVSLGGLAEFHRLEPSAQTKHAIDRGIDFLLHAIYPDLKGIETIDERNRYGHPSNLQHALLWNPAGRNLFARFLERSRSEIKPGNGPLMLNDFRMMGGAFRCYDHALATRSINIADSLPIDQHSFSWNLENKALVRKTGDWFHVLSAYTHHAQQGNPYQLDRTQALSIFHERTGLLVGGGNDKRAYHAATIHVLESGECSYFPPCSTKLLPAVAPKILPGKTRCDALELDYGSAHARLEIRADSPTTLRLAAAVTTTQTKPHIYLVLQLPLKAPITLRTGGRKLVLKVPAEAQASENFPLGKDLESPQGWRMALPNGSTLLWPHFPWHPYRPPTHRETPDKAVALLRIPLHALNWQAEVTIECRRKRASGNAACHSDP